jgi:two-component sensor histidine kinase
MTPSPIPGPRWSRWLILVAFWTALGFSFAAQLYISTSRLGHPVSWGYALYHSLCDWYVFAILSIPVVWLSRRYPVDRTNWKWNVPLHLVASGAFAFLFIVLRAWVAQVQGWFTGQPTSFAQAFQVLLLKSFQLSLLIYWVIVTVGHTLNYYSKAQEREMRTLELERHLAQARLQALQMQLNPHFLFNTLHAISALMHKDVEAADCMIARLSDLLRYALESTDAQEVPLRQELAFLERYLEIEQTRFGERLVIEKQIDPTALDARVPNLILQPLVENAIRHGIEPHARRGEITLWAQRRNGMLDLEVRDNGSGLSSANASPDEGVGLSNTRARLAELYGDSYRFEFRNREEGGLIVHVSIPCRMEEENAARSQPTGITT